MPKLAIFVEFCLVQELVSNGSNYIVPSQRLVLVDFS